MDVFIEDGSSEVVKIPLSKWPHGFVITGSSLLTRPGDDFFSQQETQTIISEQARIDAALHDQISSGLDYVHNATVDTASLALLLIQDHSRWEILHN